MCLLKRSDRDTGCGHDECKNFYMLNKQMCMYNLNQQPQATNSNPQNVTLSAIHPQIQLTSLFSQKPTSFTASQPSLNGKRLASTSVENDQETFFLNKKQIKTDTVDENKTDDTNQINLQTNLSDLNLLSQQIINQNPGIQNTQQAQFINGINPANGQLCYIKQGDNGLQFPNSAIYIPYVQQVQQGNVAANQAFAPLLANGQNGFTVANGAQLFSQNLRIKPTNNNNSIVNVNSINLNTTDSNSRAGNSTNTPTSNAVTAQTGVITANTNNPNTAQVETVMKEFQSRISDLLLSQNKMLIDLKEKNEIIQDTLACLINEMSALKSVIRQTPQEKQSVGNGNTMLYTTMAINSNETATTEGLLNCLYGPKPDFQYQLLLKTNLSLPLYRERNFKFTVLLVDKNGKPVENSNKIPVTIGIYSSESVPKYIDANTAGNKILKGFIDKDLVNGSVTFDKIQIKEVTSHFRNGWIFFVVYPKVASNAAGAVLGSGKDNLVNSQKIRPLIIEKVIVKAKKAKEKDADEQEEDIFQQDNESQQAQPQTETETKAQIEVEIQPTEENSNKQEIKA